MFATSQAKIHFQCFLDGDLDDHAFGGRNLRALIGWSSVLKGSLETQLMI
jgi:hypothetical protein